MTNFGSVIKNMVSFSEFNRGQAGKIFDSVKTTGTKIVIKNNSPECVIMSIDEYSKLTEEINDARLLLTAVDRLDEFDGNMKNTFSQEEVIKMFGIAEDEEVEIE